jgi:hypothetical protein
MVKILFLICLPQMGLGVELTVYPQAPGTELDPRLVASVHLSGSNRPPLSDLRLAVEDAPATPQTRDPGYGRPPFTSSRLRLATGDGASAVRVALQCIGVGCTFGKGAVLRGVNFDGHVEYNGSNIAFNLPAPGHYIATHYYLQVVVQNATGAPHFARGKLFYFWLDSQDSIPSAKSTRPAQDVTALGILSNSTTPQTEAIQRLLDNITLPRLYFPGPAVYRTASLFVQRPMSIILGEGATLQHPPPPIVNPLFDSATRSSTPPSNHTKHVTHHRLGASSCSGPAFLTISAHGVHVSGRGGTLDANGFAGHNVCVVDATNVTLRYLLLRGSASWSTHIFRSDHVAVEGIKIFSGADGIDPDNSRDVSLRSVFVHSNDDAIAVKATVAGSNTERVVCEHALLSTKKSCVKVGTESLSNFNDVLFSDIEGFDLDRGLVLYPSDGGKFANVMFRRIRLSSFYPYEDESRDGAALDFETKHRAGLSQLTNISVIDIVVSNVTGSSLLKGIAGAKIENVAIRNLTLVMGMPNDRAEGSRMPFVFECHGFVDTVTVENLHLQWGMYRNVWAGLQNDPNCLHLYSGH